MPCVNAQVESRECSKTDCESRNFVIFYKFLRRNKLKNFSEPYFSEWNEWSDCSNDTDSYRFRIRECLRPEIIECRMGERIQYEICSSNVTSVSPSSSTLPPTTTSLAFDEILELSGQLILNFKLIWKYQNVMMFLTKNLISLKRVNIGPIGVSVVRISCARRAFKYVRKRALARSAWDHRSRLAGVPWASLN